VQQADAISTNISFFISIFLRGYARIYELTTLNVYAAADNGLISFAAEPVEKPDARFFCAADTGKSMHFAGRSELSTASLRPDWRR
jgi:hypothetical protein